jgi:hypothetical protein
MVKQIFYHIFKVNIAKVKFYSLFCDTKINDVAR